MAYICYCLQNCILFWWAHEDGTQSKNVAFFFLKRAFLIRDGFCSRIPKSQIGFLQYVSDKYFFGIWNHQRFYCFQPLLLLWLYSWWLFWPFMSYIHAMFFFWLKNWPTFDLSWVSTVPMKRFWHDPKNKEES